MCTHKVRDYKLLSLPLSKKDHLATAWFPIQTSVLSHPNYSHPPLCGSDGEWDRTLQVWRNHSFIHPFMLEHTKFIPASKPLQFPLPWLLSPQVIPRLLPLYIKHLKRHLPQQPSQAMWPLLAIFHHITLLNFIHDNLLLSKMMSFMPTLFLSPSHL